MNSETKDQQEQRILIERGRTHEIEVKKLYDGFMPVLALYGAAFLIMHFYDVVVFEKGGLIDLWPEILLLILYAIYYFEKDA